MTGPVVFAHAGHLVADLVVFLGPVLVLVVALAAHTLRVRRLASGSPPRRPT